MSRNDMLFWNSQLMLYLALDNRWYFSFFLALAFFVYVYWRAKS